MDSGEWYSYILITVNGSAKGYEKIVYSNVHIYFGILQVRWLNFWEKNVFRSVVEHSLFLSNMLNQVIRIM